jgi:hypothetical protein
MVSTVHMEGLTVSLQPRLRQWSRLSGLVARMTRSPEIQERQTVSCNI